MTSLSSRLSGNQRFEFVSDAYGADTFAVVRMQGHEAISQLYRFELVLVSDDAQIDLERMLQQNATLQILAPDDARKRTPYSGMLAEFDQLHHANGYTFYRAVLVPRAWRLTLSRTSEVYLNEQTIPQTIEKLLRDAQLAGNNANFKLTGQYRPRSYVCQYQESHFDFISRWMEKEGMYYYFAQDGRSDTLEVVDDKAMHAVDAIAVNYRPADELDTGLAPDSVQAFVCQQRPMPRQVVLQDYNYRKASVPLVVQAQVSPNGVGEAMFYGDNFRNATEGQRYANLRAQELLCGAKVFAGEATAVGLRSGYFMQVSHHYRDDFNGRYLVTEISHEGSQAGALLAGIKTPFGGDQALPGQEIIYRNSFRAIPASVQFRAARTTPKPRVAGIMNATIDAEGSGQYAELDQYGQYKVQLPFDRTDKAADKSSARVRLATPYSGDGHGMHFPLHKSAEVLLSFTDGDPDQPVIVGTVPNSVNANMVDQSNPHENRISTSAGNEVYMSDTKGRESIALHSPGSKSSLLIGKTPPGKTGANMASDSQSFDGISLVTAGAINSFAVGLTNRISVGQSSSAFLTGDSNLSLLHSSKAVIGSQVGMVAGNSVTWNIGRAINLNSQVLTANADNKVTATGSVVLSGGTSGASLAAVAALGRAQTLTKIMLVALGAVNTTASAAAAAGMIAADAEGKYGDTWARATLNGGPGVVQLGTNVLHIIGIAAAVQKYASSYAKLKLVSTMKLDNTGIDLSATFPAGLLPETTTLKMGRDSAVLETTTPANSTGTATLKSEKAEIKVVKFGGAQSTALSITSADATIEASLGPKFSVSQTEIEAKVATAGIAIDSTCVGAVVGTSAITLMADSATTSVGPATIELKATGAKIMFAGNNASINAIGCAMQGTLVQLG